MKILSILACLKWQKSDNRRHASVCGWGERQCAVWRAWQAADAVWRWCELAVVWAGGATLTAFDCVWGQEVLAYPGCATLTAFAPVCATLIYAGKSRPNVVIPVLWGPSISGFQTVLENRLKYQKSTPVIRWLQAFVVLRQPQVYFKYSKLWSSRARASNIWNNRISK